MPRENRLNLTLNDNELNSLKEIEQYLKEIPGASANRSNAVRFAIITKAADIRLEKSKLKDIDGVER